MKAKELFVFDLDFTLWACGGTWCDHTDPPYVKDEVGLRDQKGRMIRLYPEVLNVLKLLCEKQRPMTLASRTSAPDWANELLELFGITDLFTHKQIYPGSKLNHFHEISNRFDCPYEEMVFFDDEYRNIEEVSKLGVKTIYVENGITTEMVMPYI